MRYRPSWLADIRPCWAQIVAFRNLVVHEYGRVWLNLVWAIVQNNLPPLKVTVEQILQELPEVWVQHYCLERSLWQCFAVQAPINFLTPSL
jgi:hypothetical protein